MEKAVDVILTQGGLFGALFLLAAGVAAYLYRERRKSDEDHRKALEDLQAKREQEFAERLADSKTLVLALDQSSKNNIVLEQSSKERDAAIDEVTQGFKSLVTQIGAREERCAEYLARYDRKIESIDRNLEQALRR